MSTSRSYCLRCFQRLDIDPSSLPVWRSLRISDRIGVQLAALAAAVVVAFVWWLWSTSRVQRDNRQAHESPAPTVAPAASPQVGTPPPAEPAANTSAPADDATAIRQDFENRLKLDPTNEATLMGLGGVLERTGALPEALDAFRRASAAAPASATPRLRAAAIEARLRQFQAAIADYRAALTLVPGDYAARCDLAAVLHENGDDRAAVDELEAATRIAPQEPRAYRALGAGLETLGRRADAARAYERYVALAPSADDVPLIKRKIDSLSAAS